MIVARGARALWINPIRGWHLVHKKTAMILADSPWRLRVGILGGTAFLNNESADLVQVGAAWCKEGERVATDVEIMLDPRYIVYHSFVYSAFIQQIHQMLNIILWVPGSFNIERGERLSVEQMVDMEDNIWVTCQN